MKCGHCPGNRGSKGPRSPACSQISATKNMGFSKRRDGDHPYPRLPTDFLHNTLSRVEIHGLNPRQQRNKLNQIPQPLSPTQHTTSANNPLQPHFLHHHPRNHLASSPHCCIPVTALRLHLLPSQPIKKPSHDPTSTTVRASENRRSCLKTQHSNQAKKNLGFFIAYSKRTGRTCSVLICFPNTYCLFLINAH